MSGKQQMKVCKWSVLFQCKASEPSDSMCVACMLVYLEVALKHEDLAGAGAHTQILSEILMKDKVIAETDFRKVFENKIRDKGEDYTE